MRKPVGRLPSGALVLGLADTVCLNDPITGQGSNNASKAAKVYMDAIVARGDRPFDAAFMQATFDAYWAYAQFVTGWTNALLQPAAPACAEPDGRGAGLSRARPAHRQRLQPADRICSRGSPFPRRPSVTSRNSPPERARAVIASGAKQSTGRVVECLVAALPPEGERDRSEGPRMTDLPCHEANRRPARYLDCFAPLAMTVGQ